jgi:ABC-type transport system involved in cytochrome c biogenesis permease component
MFEHRSQPLISPRDYAHRLLRSAVAGLTLVVPTLLAGMLGYRYIEDLDWTDAFLEAAMLLGGMGPLHEPATQAGKIFAGLYAIVCGLLVLLVASVMMAPIVHRAMHRFHLESDPGDDRGGEDQADAEPPKRRRGS